MDLKRICRAREILTGLTPLTSDCGALCGAACCAADEDEQGGVFLFPGEAELIGDVQWARIEPADALGGCLMLTCDGTCERDKRPLGCRIFPLTPVPLKSGGWGVRIDRRAHAMCPLAASGTKGLRPEFVDAVRAAMNEIAGDAEGDQFLRAWAKLERQYGEFAL